MIKILLRRPLLLLISTLALLIACATTNPRLVDLPETFNFKAGKFFNPNGVKITYDNLGSIIKRSIFEERISTPPFPSPVESLSNQLPDIPTHTAFYRLGHSSILLAINGEYWLTDPMFSKRASFVQWAGPKRFHAPPLTVDELPPIKGVVLSHNHYDHLDKLTIKALHDKVDRFFVPLGVDEALLKWGVPEEKITALNWWQSVTVGNVEVVATPAQHFSGRSLTDGNRTLWASWVLLAPDASIFFSGDTGYFDGFKTIGEKYGPFDVTLLETGAYDREWQEVHMLPEQSLQAHRDLRGKLFVPIHNGTFDLGLHDWDDPFKQVLSLAGDTQAVMPKMGEPVPLDAPPPVIQWWLEQQKEASQ